MFLAGVARALDVAATERPGSILIFPKVVADGTRDTVIQISNTGNVLDQARCFYLNGRQNRGVADCDETDFLISLTKQQPTGWVAGSGRFPTGSNGLDPGMVPPVPAGFTGALVCAEVDASMHPIAANALKGEATLVDDSGVNLSKYNGIAFAGGTAGANDHDNDLNLDGTEYSTCPAASRVNFVTPGVLDPIVSGLGAAGVCINDSGSSCATDADCATGACALLTCVGGAFDGAACASASDCPNGTCNGAALASVKTNVTVLPCNMDLNEPAPTTTEIQVKAWDGAEVMYSNSIPVGCWSSFDIASLSAVKSVNTDFGTLEFYTAGAPVLVMIETFNIQPAAASIASAATNAHVEQKVCIGSSVPAVNGTACTTASDCTGGGTCPQPTAVIRLPGV
jgi:hypothetical protein